MIALTSALAAVARAWSGRSMIRGTIRAARMPMMVMTTRISISVKPRNWLERFGMWVPECRISPYFARSAHQRVHLEDRQQDRYDHEQDDPPHGEDQQRLEERR